MAWMAWTKQNPPSLRRTPARTTSRRARTVVWLLTGLQTLVFVVISVIYPAWQEPDEPAHVDMVLAYRHGDWLEEPGQRYAQIGILQSNHDMRIWLAQAHQGARDTVPFDQRPSLDQLGTSLGGDLPNQMVQHPPAYYIAAAGYSYLIPDFEKLRFDVQVFLLRLFTMILLLPMPWLIYRMTMRLTGSPNVGLIATVMILLLPSYLRMGASVTNDSLLTLLGTCVLALLARVTTGDNSVRTALLVGGIFGLGLLTKGTMLIMPPVLVACYIVGRQFWSNMWRPMMISLIVPAVIGGWWWFRNIVEYGAIQPSGFGPLFGTDQLYGPDRAGGDLSEFSKTVSQLFSRRLWGTLGLLDSPRLSNWVPYALSALTLIVVAVGLVIGCRRAPRRMLAPTALVLAPVLVLGTVLVGSYGVYIHKQVFPGIQPRYLLPFMSGSIVVAAVAVSKYFGRWAPLLMIAGWAIWAVVWTQYVVSQLLNPGVSGFWRRLVDGWQFVSGWAPWPRFVILLLLIATVVFFGFTVLRMVQMSRSAGRGPTMPKVRGLRPHVAELSG